MGSTEDPATRARRRCAYWLSGQCHGGQCDCMTRLRKDLEAEQPPGVGPTPQPEKPNDSKENTP